jgi:Holliday junction resolvase RusA-like endonuclease
MQTATVPREFIVVGDPKGEPRHRSTVRGKHAHIYVPKTADAWKYAVRGALMEQLDGYADWPVFPIGTAVGLRVTFFMPRPKSHYVAGDRDRDLKPSAPFWCTSKPDADNMLKAVADCLGPWPKGSKGLLWDDDQQVCCMAAIKMYTPVDREPGAMIEVDLLGQ